MEEEKKRRVWALGGGKGRGEGYNSERSSMHAWKGGRERGTRRDWSCADQRGEGEAVSFKGDRGLSNDVKVDQSVNDGRGHYVFKVGLPTHEVIVAPEGDAPNVRIITS
jgi:hypothetical protein